MSPTIADHLKAASVMEAMAKDPKHAATKATLEKLAKWRRLVAQMKARKGLDTPFFPKGKPGPGQTFDPEIYEKAKPFFRAGMEHFAQVGRDRDLATMVQEFVRYLAETAGMSREALGAMKPYICRFVDDVCAGKETIDA